MTRWPPLIAFGLVLVAGFGAGLALGSSGSKDASPTSNRSSLAQRSDEAPAVALVPTVLTMPSPSPVIESVRVEPSPQATPQPHSAAPTSSVGAAPPAALPTPPLNAPVVTRSTASPSDFRAAAASIRAGATSESLAVARQLTYIVVGGGRPDRDRLKDAIVVLGNYGDRAAILSFPSCLLGSWRQLQDGLAEYSKAAAGALAAVDAPVIAVQATKSLTAGGDLLKQSEQSANAC